MRLGLALALWLATGAVAVINGYVGNILVSPQLGEYGAHVYKTVVAVAVVLLFSWVYARSTSGSNWAKVAWTVGIAWVVLTVCFEFVFGHYVFGNSWERLIADYRVWEGRLWTLLLVAQLTGPALMGLVLNR